jgi:hypothetical protein
MTRGRYSEKKLKKGQKKMHQETKLKISKRVRNCAKV